MSEEIQSVAKACRVARLLAGHPVQGLSNQEIAEALGLSAPNVTRILGTLIAEGWASKLGTGRFAPGITLLGLSAAAHEALDRTAGRVTEIKRNIAASAAQHRSN